MAVYAIGDVQGCFAELRRLVRRTGFDPASDRLWLVGDLVNRGPRSLDVLRYVKALGDAAVTVLGNHDLHLLGCAFGVRRPKPVDTIDDVLRARDRKDLLDWLVSRPFLYQSGEYLLAHAGLDPSWDAATAVALAAEAEAALRHDPRGTLACLRGAPAPPRWHPGLEGDDRLRSIIAILTRIRTCAEDGTVDPAFSGPPRLARDGYRPWFDWPGAYAAEATVVCGHWSALGLRIEPHVVALDTGCVWGRALTAVRLNDGRVFRQPARGSSVPAEGEEGQP